MSLNNEYVALLKYAICLNIDISMFPTVWAVLSFLLDTQDSNHEYVKLLQEEYNRYYESKSRQYMEKFEKKSIEIQNRMHDIVTHDFDRVSDYTDNGSTPLQGQQDEQPEAINSAENAVKHDVADILTRYPSWSTDTFDIDDNNEVICDRNRKEIQDELYKDTPVKTEDNKSYMDNIDAYNRDRALITQSLNDRLGLGQNGLLGTQQVRVATEHTNQMTDIPDYLRWMSLGEETESTSYEETYRNRYIRSIIQVDHTMDSKDSLNQTPDSINLFESPVKHTNTQRDTEKSNEDTSYNDIDEMIEFNKDKARKIYRKDTNEQRKRVKIVKSNKGRTTKVNAINIERKRILKQRREKVLQNAKNRKIGQANAQTALQASTRATKALKDTHNIEMTINSATSKESTVDVHLPPHSSGKAKHPSQIKTSSKHRTVITEPSIGNPIPRSQATVKVNGQMPDPGDIGINEFFIDGAPNPPDLEGVE